MAEAQQDEAQDEEKKEWLRDEFGQFSSDSDIYTVETPGARDGDTRAKDEFGRHITRQHQDAQKAVCAICFKKASKNKARKMSEDQRNEIVQCGVFTEFADKEFEWLPTVICDTCRKNLAAWSKQRKSGVDIR